MRVHELSKELGVGSKNLVALAKKLGSQATTHMSLIEDEVVAKLRAQHSAKPAAAKTKAAPAVAAAPAKVAAKTAAPAQAAKKTEVKTPPPAAPGKALRAAPPSGAKVGKVLEIDLPRPRTRKMLLEHPDYYALREQLLSFLAECDHG